MIDTHKLYKSLIEIWLFGIDKKFKLGYGQDVK